MLKDENTRHLKSILCQSAMHILFIENDLPKPYAQPNFNVKSRGNHCYLGIRLSGYFPIKK